MAMVIRLAVVPSPLVSMSAALDRLSSIDDVFGDDILEFLRQAPEVEHVCVFTGAGHLVR